MIEFKNVSFTYQSSKTETGVKNVNLQIPAGQIVLLCGKSGCGKTTLTRLLNGLIPEYYEGRLQGKVKIDDIVVSESPLYRIAKKVGSVFQNPRSQFFNVDTTSEIAFGCENMGLPTEMIYQRMGEVIGELKISNLMDRNLFALSGGEKQKIACASVAAMEPEVFVLDEPSSNLDIAAIEDLRQMIGKWKQKGKTIVIAEHRLYYLMELVDRVLYMENGEITQDLTTAEFKQINSAKIKAMGLRSLHPTTLKENKSYSFSDETIQLRNLYFSYGKDEGINIPELTIPKSTIVGILGNNGAGKSTFGRCLCGLLKNEQGEIVLDGQKYRKKEKMRLCYMVMQDVNHQIFTESVLDEIILGINDEEGNQDFIANDILKKLNLFNQKDLHPMSLSGGEKQRVAIGSAIASSKGILVFDEPTSGLDYRHMVDVSQNFKKLKDEGKTLFVITHDPELITHCCDYLLFMEDGKIKWSGDMHEALDKMNRFFELV